MKENYLVDVIIPLPLNKHYTYSSKSRVEIGTHLKVPFGNNNEIADAITISDSYKKDTSFPIKGILSVEKKILSKKQIQFFVWASKYYLVELPKVINSLFPKHIFNISKISKNEIKYRIDNLFKCTVVVDNSKNYFSFIDNKTEKLEDKKSQILILCPNILKSYELVRRLKSRAFLYNSSISDKESKEIWEKVLNNEDLVIIGVKSALFLPFKNLREIFVVDENDIAYKESDKILRFNARDSAVMLSKIHNCKINLMCNFPSIESTKNIKEKKYNLINKRESLELKVEKRININNILEKKIKEQYDGIISNDIRTKILERFKKNKKTLIFTPLSSNIKVIRKSLSFLGSENVKIYELIKKNLNSKTKINNLIKSIEKFDIIIGNQSVLFNSLFKNFDLIILIEPEKIGKRSNYRSNEILFNLLYKSVNYLKYNQSSSLIILTNESQNKIFKSAIKLDYKGFIKGELIERKLFKYPPYSKIIKIELISSNYTKKSKMGKFLFENIKKDFKNLNVKDIGFDSNDDKYEIIIKITYTKSLSSIKEKIKKFLSKKIKNNGFSEILINIDIDP